MKKQRSVADPEIKISSSYGYFDGVATKFHNKCLSGGILHISDPHQIRFKDGLGSGTNNFADQSDLHFNGNSFRSWRHQYLSGLNASCRMVEGIQKTEKYSFVWRFPACRRPQIQLFRYMLSSHLLGE